MPLLFGAHAGRINTPDQYLGSDLLDLPRGRGEWRRRYRAVTMTSAPSHTPLPQYGLYSAIVGGFVYFVLGTSRDVTLGPTALMSLLVSAYTPHKPAFAVLLAFLSGLIQLAMGFLRLGEPGRVPLLP